MSYPCVHCLAEYGDHCKKSLYTLAEISHFRRRNLVHEKELTSTDWVGGGGGGLEFAHA